MDQQEAARLLTETLRSTYGLAEIKTAPTDRQIEALRSIDLDAPAPDPVLEAMELEQGKSWGAALREVGEFVVEIVAAVDDLLDG